MGVHALLGHGLCHFRAFRHFSRFVQRNSRLCRNLDKKSQAETYHGQDAEKFHRAELAR